MLSESGKDAFFAFEGMIFVVLVPQGRELIEQVVKFREGYACQGQKGGRVLLLVLIVHRHKGRAPARYANQLM